MKTLTAIILSFLRKEADGRPICTSDNPAPWPYGSRFWIHTGEQLIHIYDDGKTIEMRCDNCNSQWTMQVKK